MRKKLKLSRFFIYFLNELQDQQSLFKMNPNLYKQFENLNLIRQNQSAQWVFQLDFRCKKNNSFHQHLDKVFFIERTCRGKIQIRETFRVQFEGNYSDDGQLIKIQEINQPNIQFKKGFMKASRLMQNRKKTLFQYIWQIFGDERSFVIKTLFKELQKLKEIAMIRQIDRYVLIKLDEVYETDNSPYMVLDLLGGGSLFDKVKINYSLMHLKLKCLFFSLLERLHHMHSKNIMQRLKTRKLCIQKIGYLCILLILDQLNVLNEFPYLFNRCGTPGFVAPEVIYCKVGGRHDSITDIQFRINILYFSDDCFESQTHWKISISCVPQQAYDLLINLLDKFPKTRISAKEVLSHGYLGRRLKQIEENEGDALKNQEEQLKFINRGQSNQIILHCIHLQQQLLLNQKRVIQMIVYINKVLYQMGQQIKQIRLQLTVPIISLQTSKWLVLIQKLCIF
ncbi:unnamed protein product [Paramecium octaurelia]|uniref:non-specific serine/threonine protein kinase n=1 Tax=Paramecium octaurelia TaxID=43137 RepID=A0A8S1VQG9_PAROT|nr:unnamed protein product [Paramecium octaurelia]